MFSLREALSAAKEAQRAAAENQKAVADLLRDHAARAVRAEIWNETAGDAELARYSAPDGYDCTTNPLMFMAHANGGDDSVESREIPIVQQTAAQLWPTAFLGPVGTPDMRLEPYIRPDKAKDKKYCDGVVLKQRQLGKVVPDPRQIFTDAMLYGSKALARQDIIIGHDACQDVLVKASSASNEQAPRAPRITFIGKEYNETHRKADCFQTYADTKVKFDTDRDQPLPSAFLKKVHIEWVSAHRPWTHLISVQKATYLRHFVSADRPLTPDTLPEFLDKAEGVQEVLGRMVQASWKGRNMNDLSHRILRDECFEEAQKAVDDDDELRTYPTNPVSSGIVWMETIALQVMHMPVALYEQIAGNCINTNFLNSERALQRRAGRPINLPYAAARHVVKWEQVTTDPCALYNAIVTAFFWVEYVGVRAHYTALMQIANNTEKAQKAEAKAKIAADKAAEKAQKLAEKQEKDAEKDAENAQLKALEKASEVKAKRADARRSRFARKSAPSRKEGDDEKQAIQRTAAASAVRRRISEGGGDAPSLAQFSKMCDEEQGSAAVTAVAAADNDDEDVNPRSSPSPLSSSSSSSSSHVPALSRWRASQGIAEPLTHRLRKMADERREKDAEDEE